MSITRIPPNHIGTIIYAIVPSFTVTCGMCSREQSVDSSSTEDAAIDFLKAGWRRDETERGVYLLCPSCAELPGPKERRDKRTGL